MDYICVIDYGTQSVRAMLFSFKGELFAKEQLSVTPYFSEHQGWAENNPNYMWEQLCKVSKSLFANAKVTPESIKAVALTTQRASVINVDSSGQPLRNAIIWADKRTTDQYEPLGGVKGALIKLAGFGKFVNRVQSYAKLNWIKAHEPEVWKQTYKYLYLSGFLTHRLTGKFVDSTACQVGYMPFDYKLQKWSREKSLNNQLIPLESDKRVELKLPGQVLGVISDQASRQTSIPAGIPLIAAGGDKACEVLGVGAMSSNIAAICLGTTATINAVQKHYKEPFPHIPPYPAAIPGYYNLEVQVMSGFSLVSWFLNEFAQSEVSSAREKGIRPETLLDSLLDQTPPGADGLFVQPYWEPSPVYPGIEAKGVIAGFSEFHKRAHVYRSIIEGIAYALRDGKEQLEKRIKSPLSDIRVAGGGANSERVLQILADVFGQPIQKSAEIEATGLGAAINAAVGVGFYGNYEEAITNMVKAGTTFKPNSKHSRLYTSIFKEVYNKAYKRLSPLYNRIDQVFNSL